MNEKNLVKVFFEWKDDDTLRSESLWAEGLDVDHFRLDNVPFFVYGVSYNDIVTTIIKEDNFFFKDVSERGGHSTLRVFFLSQDSNHQQELIENINTLGGTIERASASHIAIDIPKNVKIEPIIDLLIMGEKEGLWEYEEGYIYK